MGKIQGVEKFMLSLGLQDIIDSPQGITAAYQDDSIHIPAVLEESFGLKTEVGMGQPVGTGKIIDFIVEEFRLSSEGREEFYRGIFADVTNHFAPSSCSRKAFTLVIIWPSLTFRVSQPSPSRISVGNPLSFKEFLGQLGEPLGLFTPPVAED